MKTTIDRKELALKQRRYILNAVHLNDYDQYKHSVKTNSQRLEVVREIFLKEYAHEVKRIGEQKAFAEWLKGLPSCLNIDFVNHKILSILKEWGLLDKEASEAKEDKALEMWWNGIYMIFDKACKFYSNKGPKIATIDVNALEWFDKVNGNSYFAGTVTINLRRKTEQTLTMPYQYGYGEHYLTEAMQLLDSMDIIRDAKHYSTGGVESLWSYCDEHGIDLRYNKTKNCKKSELKALAA